MLSSCCPPLLSPSKPPWSDRHLRALRTDVRRACRLYSQRRSVYHKRLFKYASKAYRVYNRARYFSYLSRLQSRLSADPRSFWRFAKSRRGSSNLPTSLSLGSVTATSPDGVCDLFARHFSGLFVDPASSSLCLTSALAHTPHDSLSIDAVPISEDSVLAAIANLKLSHSPGSDGIPSSVLKGCSLSLAPILVQLFSRSLREGSFPRGWKSAWLIPIHKKGCRQAASNYRGISLLCAVSKILESVVHSYLLPLVSPSIAVNQHGFMPKRSTVTNLMSLMQRIYPAAASSSQVDVVYTDFSAAFDCISHSLLVAKLRQMGLCDPLLSWIQSFLTGRSFRVKTPSSTSPSSSIPSGVPQGSVLSPLLFSLFINDCSAVLPPDGFLMYADDVKFLLPVSNPDDARSLQRVIDDFAAWCSSNGLRLSPSKCCVISFSRLSSPLSWNYSLLNSPLPRVSTVKDLGVCLDDVLSFTQQIEATVAKANKILGCITRMSRDIRDPWCLRALFCCWVRPVLEYACVVWSPSSPSSMDRLEKVQRRFTRLAIRRLLGTSASTLPPYDTRCRMLGLPTIASRHSFAQSLFIANLLLHNMDAPSLLSSLQFYAPSRRLRDRPPFLIPPRRSRFGSDEPFLRAIGSFNAASHLFDFHLPVSSFRSRLRASTAPSI